MKTKEVRFTVTGAMNIPDDSVPVHAADGQISGWRLPNGRLLQPLAAFELFNKDESKSSILATDKAMQRVGVAIITYDDTNFEE